MRCLPTTADVCFDYIDALIGASVYKKYDSVRKRRLKDAQNIPAEEAPAQERARLQKKNGYGKRQKGS